MKEFQISVISRCNLRCNFCQNSDEYQKASKIVSPKEVKNFIDFSVQWGADSVELGTLIGEATLYPSEYMKEVIEHCKQYEHLYLIIFTSGASYNKKLLDVLNSYPRMMMAVSLYGGNKEQFLEKTNKDLFHNVLKTIQYLEGSNINAWITNRSGILEKDIGFDTILEFKYFAPDFKWNLGESKTKLIKERNGHCKWMDDDVGITVDGDVQFCTWLDIEGDTKLGHYTEGVQAIKNKYKAKKLMQDSNIFTGICINCEAYERYNA